MPLPRRVLRTILPAWLLLAAAASAQTTVENGGWRLQTTARVIAVSDVHGADVDFVSLLRNLDLIDDADRWRGGGDFLVIVGDILDRGAGSRDVLELLMRLEQEASQAGGMVQLVLGNHEVMNLVGDLRYVGRDEYARYADLEDPEERKRAREDYRARTPRLGVKAESFDDRYPPGFFAHRRLFSGNGKFGRWLLQRPAILIVNDTVFVHGGLSPAMQGLGLNEINSRHQETLKDYLRSMDTLIESDLMDPAEEFYNQPAVARDVLGDRPGPVVNDAAQTLLDGSTSAIFALDSVTWYRGNVGCSPATEADRLAAMLGSLGAARLVVGHTPTATRSIETRLDARLVRVDTGMLSSYYRGRAAAAFIQGDTISAYYAADNEHTAPVPQPRHVAPPGNPADDDLETLLANGPIVRHESRRGGTRQLQFDYHGHVIAARFTPAEGRHGGALFMPAVAAYRLDRYLGLDVVPVAVPRTIDGVAGAVQVSIAGLIDESQRAADGLGASAWCPLPDQFNMMYLFDALVHNRGRAKEEMYYRTGDMKLMLGGYDKILGIEENLPRYLRTVEIDVPHYAAERLRALDEQVLQAMLGDVLDAGRRAALLKRRDRLLNRTP